MADSQEVTIALLHMNESEFMFDALKGPAPTDEEVVPGPLMCGELGVMERVRFVFGKYIPPLVKRKTRKFRRRKLRK